MERKLKIVSEAYRKLQEESKSNAQAAADAKKGHGISPAQAKAFMKTLKELRADVDYFKRFCSQLPTVMLKLVGPQVEKGSYPEICSRNYSVN